MRGAYRVGSFVVVGILVQIAWNTKVNGEPLVFARLAAIVMVLACFVVGFSLKKRKTNDDAIQEYVVKTALAKDKSSVDSIKSFLQLEIQKNDNIKSIVQYLKYQASLSDMAGVISSIQNLEDVVLECDRFYNDVLEGKELRK